MTADEFKRRFSEALHAVRDGETIVVTDGRHSRKVAVVIPYSDFKRRQHRPLGLLKSTVRVTFYRNFALTDDEFLKA